MFSVFSPKNGPKMPSVSRSDISTNTTYIPHEKGTSMPSCYSQRTWDAISMLEIGREGFFKFKDDAVDRLPTGRVSGTDMGFW
jgi:hypothetical protein